MTAKPIKITEERALDAAKEYSQARKQMQKDFSLLQIKHNKEVQDFFAGWKKQFRDLFRTATAPYLDDPDEAFSKDSHVLDISYVELGDVYLLVNPQNSQAEQVAEETTGEYEQRKIVVN